AAVQRPAEIDAVHALDVSLRLPGPRRRGAVRGVLEQRLDPRRGARQGARTGTPAASLRPRYASADQFQRSANSKDAAAIAQRSGTRPAGDCLQRALLLRPVHRVSDGVLYLPRVLHDVLRRGKDPAAGWASRA